jgi:hypothetical protein
LTTDETWLSHHYDPETKQQSMEWRYSGSPCLKNFLVQNSVRKVLASFFGTDQDGILLKDYLPKGQTINAEYYSSLSVQLKDMLNKKRRAAGSPKGHYIASDHRELATQKKLAHLAFQYLDHSPYSPDLAR